MSGRHALSKCAEDGPGAFTVCDHSEEITRIEERPRWSQTPGRGPRAAQRGCWTSSKAFRASAGRLARRAQPGLEGQIVTAALDPFRGYATALAEQLPDAVRALDAFHVVKLGKLGLTALNDVRRRVQHTHTGHRGHQHAPLYWARRLLRRRADRLDQRGWDRLRDRLDAGDPDGEVTAA